MGGQRFNKGRDLWVTNQVEGRNSGKFMSYGEENKTSEASLVSEAVLILRECRW